MIRNVVFDMGGVLLAYEPWAFVQREIADYLSFSDEFYFSGLFRRKVGMSPTGYRESGGAGAAPPDSTPQEDGPGNERPGG